MATWYTATTAAANGRDTWPDVDVLDPDTLTTLLAVAQDQVTAYAPALAEGATVPDRYVYAQLRQAQNLYNAGRVGTQGTVGDGGDFVMRPFPLDWHVKAILRPNRGRPRVR